MDRNRDVRPEDRSTYNTFYQDAFTPPIVMPNV